MTRGSLAGGRRPAIALTLLIAAIALLASTGQARAGTPIEAYEALPSTTQAGGHPDIEVSFTLANRIIQQSQSACNCEDVRDATVELPEGFIGNPHAVPQCTLAQFSVDSCPIDSQLGIVHVEPSEIFEFNAAVYNMVPPPDVSGLLSFKVFFVNAPQFTRLSGRTESDYGLEAKNTSIYHGPFPLHSFKQILWGVPADPSHDLLRIDKRFTPGEESAYVGNLCDAEGELSTTDPNTVVKSCGTNFREFPAVSSNSPRTPFLQNPTTCDTPLTSSLDVLSYDTEVTHAERGWPQMSGCSQLSFNPSLYAQPTTTVTDSASGIDVNLSVPQVLSGSVPSPSELRSATVTLPPGFSLNSNGADGKTVCTEEQARFGTRLAAECPEFSRVGSLVIESSALPGPLPGFVYLGESKPGQRFRIFLAADGFGTHVKLAGTITPDPATGQLIVSFQNLPQSPLTEFRMHFFGSERGALATPNRCGTYAVTSDFTPWDSALPTQTSSQFFTLDSGPNGTACPGPVRPFSPTFEAASKGNTAGSHTPFSVDVSRPDGDQNLHGIDVTTAPGFSATIKGVPYCPQAAIDQLASPAYTGLADLAAGACPAASQIGTVTAGAGAGTRPVFVGGRVYLAGPYKGAPLSLLIVVPAVSGPYDLGNVVVRAAVEVDPLTAQVTTRSDPLPEIVEGVPLRTRSLRVDLDRPDFALNPTNCDPFSVDALISGNQGGQASFSPRYQVASCAALPYDPELSLRLTGGTNRRGHPAIHAVLKAKPGEANSHSVSVTVPKGELLDNAHIGTVCTRPQFASGTCPASAAIGTAEVTTPLLDSPLEGTVYLRSSKHELPDMALDLKGQIDIEAVGLIDSVNGRLRTTFDTVPDVPFSRITLDLAGGSKGLLVNSESLCGADKRATLRMIGQNGVAANSKVKLQVPCGPGSRGRRHAKHRHQARKAG